MIKIEANLVNSELQNGCLFWYILFSLLVYRYYLKLMLFEWRLQ